MLVALSSLNRRPPNVFSKIGQHCRNAVVLCGEVHAVYCGKACVGAGVCVKWKCSTVIRPRVCALIIHAPSPVSLMAIRWTASPPTSAFVTSPYQFTLEKHFVTSSSQGNKLLVYCKINSRLLHGISKEVLNTYDRLQWYSTFAAIAYMLQIENDY